MVSASVNFQLGRLVRVDASETTALLRVSGDWEPTVPETTPLLLVASDASSDWIEALPDPVAATASPWRAAYPVAASLLDKPGLMLALVTDGGATVSLPNLEQALLQGQLDEARKEIAALTVRAERAEMAGRPAAARPGTREALRTAESRREAAEARVAQLEEQLSAAAASQRSPRAESKLSQISTELEREQRRNEDLTQRLTNLQHELAQATEQFRTEAEARQRAEARAGAGGGHPAAPDEHVLTSEAIELRGRLAAMERDNGDLRRRLLSERQSAEQTAERYRDEVEARMRAEGRAAAAERMLGAEAAPDDPA